MTPWPTLQESLTLVHAHVIIVLGCVVLRCFYLVWLHPLADIPGPKLAALTDLWKTHAVVKKRFSTALRAQHAKYGDVVRIGPNEVSIIAPDDVKVVYGPKTQFTKGPFYDAWSILGKNQFSDRDEVTHNFSHRLIAAPYSLHHLTTLETYFDSCTDLLVRHFNGASENGSVVDLSKLLEWYAYDAVSGISFGKYFGFLESGGDTKGVVDILQQGTDTVVTAASLSSFGWILTTKPVTWLTSMVLGERGPNFYIGYGTRLVKERQALRESDPVAYEEGKDMLYRLMESTNPVTLEPLDTHLLINNSMSILAAGADTTKISMIAFLRYVYAHPPTLQRLQQEIEDAISTGNLSFPITYAQASHLDFMSACIKESMRLHPAVGMTLQRVVPPGGRAIGDRFYNAGTLVGMSPRGIHYDPRAYGKDASEWRPERWLEEDRHELERFSLVFGQGSRVCLGKNISLMEMSKLLPTIVHHYDIRIQKPEQPWKVRESWFETQYDFFCSVTRREHVESVSGV